MRVDVLTIGEALLRITPPGYQRFEQTNTTEIHIAGSELNVAVGLSRLGHCVRFISRLTDNMIGRRIERELIAQGVDASHLIWTRADRIGLYYMEEGKSPRASQVVYDRAGSAMSRITRDDLTAHLFDDRPSLFHLSGITLAISETSAATAHHLLVASMEHGVPVSFDLNHRARLWDIETAKRVSEPYMQAASVIFIAERDAQLIYDTSDLSELHNRYPRATVVMTRGAEGASAITSDGEQAHQGVFQAETVCRIGGGDAFAAGYLHAYLKGEPVVMSLRCGAAVAALKYSLPGDMPLIDREQVDALVQSSGSVTVIR